MTKLVKITLFILILMNFSTAYVNNVEKDDKTYVEKAILINKYLNGHKKKIELFIKKYKLENDSEINSKIEKINYLISALNKIENNTITEDKANKAILSILKKIKTTNDELKIILVKKKQTYEYNLKSKQNKYSKLGLKLSSELSKINKALNNKYTKGKTVFSLKESKIKKSIESLEKDTKRLKYFDKITFNSESEMKQSFLRILKNIKSEMIEIKKNIK